MDTVTSRLTRKYQATIPEAVRQRLRLQAGDTVAFDIDGDQVQLRKARSLDMAFTQSLEATLTEWTSEADEEAYGDL